MLLDRREINRILVVKPSSLGDILHTFPAVEILHRYFPEAALDWLVHPAFAGLLDYSPFPVSRRVLFERKKLGNLRSLPHEFHLLTKELREEHYDLVIDFQGLVRSSIFGFLAKGRLPVGFARPREPLAGMLYGKHCWVSMAQHAVERNVGLVNAILGTNDPVPALSLPLPHGQVQIPRLPDKRYLVGVVPGARWESKCFPAALFAKILTRLRERLPEAGFVILGTAAEREIAEEILNLTGDGGMSLAGKTGIGEMIEVLRRTDAVLSNDSGPVHAAAALGKTVFGLFGPTSPELTGPYGTQHRIYQREELACIKCLKKVCPREPKLQCQQLDAAVIAADMAEFLKGEPA